MWALSTAHDIKNYVDFLNSLQQVAIFIVGMLLAILGAINIFRNYAFIKKLFQLNADLQMTQMILKLVFLTGFYIFLTTAGLLFDELDTSIYSQVYIALLIAFGLKIVFNLIQIAYLIKKIFNEYIEAEKCLRAKKYLGKDN